MRSFVKMVLLAEAFAVATYGLGWWTVPVVAALYALVSVERNRVLIAGLCAAGGWATLFLLDVAKGPVGSMGAKLGGVMSLPPLALYAATLLFPAVIAWCAATLVPAVRRSSP